MAAFNAFTRANAEQNTANKYVVLQGRVVFLDEQGRRIDKDQQNQVSETPKRFGLESSNGKLYKFLSSDVMTDMFKSARVRDQELQITASPLADDQIEIVKIRAIRDGKLYDIFYYCEICRITAYGPGPCVCCGAEYEYKETPVAEP
jgi:hypothetical protein